MPLKLYKADGSPAVRTVLMTAEFLNLKYETQDVDVMNGETRTPEHMEKNPAHTIPMIEDDDFLLSDSHAIVAYLVSKYADEEQAKLYPSDLKTRATVNQRMYYEATILALATRSVMYGIVIDGQTGPTAKQIEDINAAYEIMERYLKKTKFVACDHITIADIACFAFITHTELVVPVDDKFVKVKAWLNILNEKDWVQKGSLHGLTTFKALLEASIEKNLAKQA